MSGNELVALGLVIIMMVVFSGVLGIVLKNIHKNKRNDQRQEMVLKLLEKYPDMTHEKILELVDQTIL